MPCGDGVPFVQTSRSIASREYKIDISELDVTSAESKATYEEIKQYVAEHKENQTFRD